MLRLSALFLLAALVATAAQAQAPREIPYQGTLADGGAPVTSATPVVFRLHDAETGGAIVWAESQTVTPDADGRFTARLGSVADLPGAFDQPLWLSVTASGTALGPRAPLGAAPYALSLPGFRAVPGEDPSLSVPNLIGGASHAVAPGLSAVTVSGGFAHTVTDNYGTIGGGSSNEVSGFRGTVGGGSSNDVTGRNGTIGGGIGNVAGTRATVAGGQGNEATGGESTIGGGEANLARGFASTVPGGASNHARGARSFAAGSSARAAHDGAFVWADGSATSDSLVSTAPNQFLLRAVGGVGIGTAAPDAQLHVETGAQRAGQFQNDGGSGFTTATLYARNTSSANGHAGWFSSQGTGTALVVSHSGSGDILRGITGSNLRFSVQSDGDVTADGTFTGGGADLAEFFPLADGAQAAPGQVVGLHGGRVSLSTDGAEQIAVISSNPAFIGNPDAADGGALVALVGQVEVDVSGAAAAGDLLIASGAADGRARAVSPARYDPASGAVLGRVLSADGGRVTALVGVDEAAALRAVVVGLRADRDRQQAELDALRAEVQAIRDALAPRAAR